MLITCTLLEVISAVRLTRITDVSSIFNVLCCEVKIHLIPTRAFSGGSALLFALVTQLVSFKLYVKQSYNRNWDDSIAHRLAYPLGSSISSL